MASDVIIRQDKDYYDFEWTSDGDIPVSEALDTTILMAIYEEERANNSEIAIDELRRGWIGNESTPGFEQGSKFWMFEQERITTSMLAELGTVINNGLQQLVDDNIAISTSANAFLKNGVINIEVIFERPSGKIERRLFTLWDNTGNNFT